MNVTCPKCGAILKAKAELAGKTAKCSKCGSPVEIPEPSPPLAARKIRRATQPQKEYATSLGIDFPSDISRGDISQRIDAALERRDEQRGKRLIELGDRESKAWEAMRKEVLAELDAEDCRLSKADPGQMVEALADRDRGAIMISFPLDHEIDFEDLTGVEFAISFSDNMDESDMRSVVISMGIAMVARSQE